MASEAEVSEVSSLFERLLRHRDLSLFLPFILGFTNTNTTTEQQNPQHPNQETTPNERIILINPFTQGMVVIEGTSTLGSLLRNLTNKDGHPPASKASIEAMPSIETGENEDGECVICLEDWEVNKVGKEMPCKHKFHSECIDKWLGIHGSCPVCRYKMPVDEEEVGKKRDEERRRVEREVWVSFSFNSGGRRSADPNDSVSSDSSPTPDHQMEG